MRGRLHRFHPPAITGRIWAGVVLAMALLCGGPAFADSWLPPKIQTFLSPDQSVRLTVMPRELANPLSYFDDQVNGKSPAGQKAGGREQARGVLERRDGEGHWVVVWDRPLMNEVSPVSALVAPSGDYVVTFDNWHMAGFGENVVVIYGPDGELIRAMALTDIVPQTYVETLPRSVSSVDWAGRHEISGDTLVLKILIPMNEEESGRQYVDIPVDLATGRIRPPSGSGWDAAIAAAAGRMETLDAAEAKHRAWMRAPLLGPDSDNEREWFRYLEEAFYRVAPEEDPRYPATKVLRLPDAPNYAPSVGWLRDALLKRTHPGTLMFASPSQENLTRVLIETAAEIPPGQLRGYRIYVAVGDAWWSRLSAAFAHSGAELIQLDPASPIPQRPERMPD